MSDLQVTIMLILMCAALLIMGFVMGRTYTIVRSRAYITDRNIVVMTLDGQEYHYVANTL